jgi:hypothetical protein
VKRLLFAAAALVAAALLAILVSLPPAHLLLASQPGDGSVAGILHVHTNRSDGLGAPDEVAAAAASLAILASLPPARLLLAGQAGDGSVAGILHVHTSRSDGLSAPDEVAASAARVGLRFVVFTDHGDATRAPDPPVYRAGVLCIDGVEISTTAGHYVALDMPASPYPLGGEPRDVVEDVKRLGGFGIAAHPDSPKRELRWIDWNAPIDGVEIVNLDTSWRVLAQQTGLWPKWRLLAALGTYPFRSAETIAGVLGDSQEILDRWGSLTRGRRVVAVAGADAHARLALMDVEPGDNRFSLAFPSYEAVFRTLSVHVRPERPLSGDSRADASAIVDALRGGHLYIAIDGVASNPAFDFTAENRQGLAREGDDLAAGGPVTLRVRSNAPAGFTATVWKGRSVLAAGHHEPEFMVAAPDGPGVYRVEIRASSWPRQPAWIMSNPIYVRGAEAGPLRGAEAGPLRGAETGGLRGGEPGDERRPEPGASPQAPVDYVFPAKAPVWFVEHDPGSRAELEVTSGEARLQYALAADPLVRPLAALVTPPLELLPSDRLSFTLAADRPMRVSVQVRTGPSESPVQRWQRSVYVDTVERNRTLFFDDFTPIGAARSPHPPLTGTPAVLFVVDTVNTRAGASGQLRIKSVALLRKGS